MFLEVENADNFLKQERF